MIKQIKQARDALDHCISMIGNKTIPDCETIVWSSGTTQRPNITLETLKTILSLLDKEIDGGWQPIETAPRDESIFICRHKKKPYATFEAAMFLDDDGWESTIWSYYVIQNMTVDTPIDSDWGDLEWQPLPTPSKGE